MSGPNGDKLDACLDRLAQWYEQQRPAPDLAARIAARVAACDGELSDEQLDWLSAAGDGFAPPAPAKPDTP
ncbi:hypothetical protein [Rugamonas rubra]|uniref:Uncharacterized protein n=1 Tax=Rugamonas rubra TaxID=758825 RepID=A0A1I4P7B3_9BURK|nr:hypothetical protein [Rugamonas rubra]SFM23263.1 hypothetical protein SAMN02982985_03289 [Rugamonas rubra]